MTLVERVAALSDQEIFNVVYTGLATQGFVAAMTMIYDGPLPSCAYRGDNGTKCGIGHLIQDDEYLPRMEGKGVTHDFVLGELKNREEFLSDLQDCHDYADNPEEMKDKLAIFAKRYGLTIPEIKEV